MKKEQEKIDFEFEAMRKKQLLALLREIEKLNKSYTVKEKKDGNEYCTKTRG